MYWRLTVPGDIHGRWLTVLTSLIYIKDDETDVAYLKSHKQDSNAINMLVCCHAWCFVASKRKPLILKGMRSCEWIDM